MLQAVVVVLNSTKTPSALLLQPEYSQYFIAIEGALKLREK
jgi:hypothetical protein